MTPLIITLCFLGIIYAFGTRVVIVDGNSMEPTYKNGSIALSTVAKINEIERYDVIIINSSKYNDTLIKRVIGLPNETLSYQNGKLYVNNNLVDDTYAFGYTGDFYVELKDNEYWCLGDNREHSTDSRALGAFKQDEIVSVIFSLNTKRLWPGESITHHLEPDGS